MYFIVNESISDYMLSSPLKGHLHSLNSSIFILLFLFCALTGTSVMSVSATDADDPMTENAYLSYSIIQQESVPAGAISKVMFGINNQTGAIYTRDVGLDREVRCTGRWRRARSPQCRVPLTVKLCALCQVVKSFRLRLQIADMGGMGLASEGVAIIHVSDINNNVPQFSPVTVSFSHSSVFFPASAALVVTAQRFPPPALGTRSTTWWRWRTGGTTRSAA